MNRSVVRVRAAALAVSTISLVGACSGDGPSEPAGGGHASSKPASMPAGDVSGSPSAKESTPARTLSLVVLGDSIALGETCGGCTTYPSQVAAAMEKALGMGVETENLSVAGAEVADLLGLVRADPAMRASIAKANAILITIGHNDLAYNRLDDPCDVAPNYPRIEWGSITHGCVNKANSQYRRDLEVVLDKIDKLRGGLPTMLRVTTVYNSAIGDKLDPTWNSQAAIEPTTFAVHQMTQTQCEVAESHDGLCADTYHALNGKDGGDSAQPLLNPADATHLSQRGEDAFAAAIIALGFSPLGR